LSKSRRELGSWGEALAGDYLLEKGYTIIARNERTPYGEIDLIAQHRSEPQGEMTSPQDVTVFVEVKTRTTQNFGYPEESITARKQANLISASLHYLQEHPQLDKDWRIDVISIERYSHQQPIIHHFEDAVR
jgi:putative endonuclease